MDLLDEYYTRHTIGIRHSGCCTARYLNPGNCPAMRWYPPVVMVRGAMTPAKNASIVPGTSREAGASAHTTRTVDTLEKVQAAEKVFSG